MNKLEQTTQELLEVGYTIEEIKAAFEEVIEKLKMMGQITNYSSLFFICIINVKFTKMIILKEVIH